MKLLTASLTMLVWTTCVWAAPEAPTTQPAAGADAPELKTVHQRASYAIGLSIGSDFKSQLVDLDPDLLTRGLKDALVGKKPLLDEEQMKEALMALQQEVHEKQIERAKTLGAKNKIEGQTFLDKNKTEKNVVTTASGLQYKVITPGSGAHPTASDVVTVHYTGKLLDGTEFDSSVKRGKPATFPVSGVIPGWTEALQLMNPGAKYQLFIPAELAYGEHGAPGGRIGPNAVLVFDVELLSVQAGEQPPAAPDTQPEKK